MTRTSVRQGLRASGWLLLVAALGLLALSWPQSFGGRTAYVRVDGHSMEPTFSMGDLAVVRRQSSYRIGDAVAYRIPAGEFGAGAVVIHRLVGGDGDTGYVTRGDNKTLKDVWHPRTGDVVGRVRYVVPGAGAKVAELTRPVYLGGLIAGLTVLTMLVPSGTRRPRQGRLRGRHRLGGVPI
jgi:signal peptidase